MRPVSQKRRRKALRHAGQDSISVAESAYSLAKVNWMEFTRSATLF